MYTHPRAALVAATLVLGLSGCGSLAAGAAGPATADVSVQPTTQPTAQPTPSGDPHGPPDILPGGRPCPGPRPADSTTMIDYVDFVHLLDRDYVRFGPVRVTRGAEVGERVGIVRCRLRDSAASPHHTARNGEASFLAPGTEIFALADRPVSEVVAARLAGGYVIYRAMPASGGGRTNLPPTELSGPLSPSG